MSVYVDDYRAPLGRMQMCHMIADTHDELVSMADAIGVARRWLQHAGTPREHFDVCLSKKKLALQNGAIEVSVQELAKKTITKREATNDK